MFQVLRSPCRMTWKLMWNNKLIHSFNTRREAMSEKAKLEKKYNFLASL